MVELQSNGSWTKSNRSRNHHHLTYLRHFKNLDRLIDWSDSWWRRTTTRLWTCFRWYLAFTTSPPAHRHHHHHHRHQDHPTCCCCATSGAKSWWHAKASGTLTGEHGATTTGRRSAKVSPSSWQWTLSRPRIRLSAAFHISGSTT